MATVNVNLTCDLQHPVQVQYIGGNMFSQDNAGNTINVEVFNDGEPATLGGSISANVIRADGATVAVSGALSGNRAYVIFPQACYAVPGTITVIIKNTESSTVTTIAAFVANVYQSTTDTVVDPGQIIPSVSALIAQIEAAVDSIPVDYSGLLATIAADYSSSKTYPVVGMYAWQGGVLKRNIVPITTAETYTAAHWTNAVIGDDLSALKSAISEIDASPSFAPFTDGKFVNFANGNVTTSANYSYSQYVYIEGYEKVILTRVYRKTSSGGANGTAFYSSNSYSTRVDGKISPYSPDIEANTYKIEVMDVPATAKYMRTTWWASTTEEYAETPFVCFATKNGYLYDLTNGHETRIAALEDIMPKILNMSGEKVDISGLFSFTDGKRVNYVTGETNNFTNGSYSGYVNIEGYSHIKVMMRYVANSTAGGLAFYTGEAESTFIEGSGHREPYNAELTTPTYKEEVIPVPSGAKYLRTTWWNTESEYYPGDVFTCYGIVSGELQEEIDGLIAVVKDLQDAIDNIGGFDGLPGYYFDDNYLPGRINTITSLIMDGSMKGDLFFWFTDPHYYAYSTPSVHNGLNGPKLINYIAEHINIRKAFCGGDLVNGNGMTQATVIKNLQLVRQHLNPIWRNLNVIVGNHEWNNPNTEQPEKAIPMNIIYELLIKDKENEIHGADELGDYYIDNPVQKIRYIFIGCEYNATISQSRVSWFVEQLSEVPSGYTVVVLSHVALNTSGVIASSFEPIATAIDTANAQGEITVACVLSGHNHRDLSTQTTGGVPIISTTCDRGKDGNSSETFNTAREYGTINEQAIEVVLLDTENKKINLVRIGGSWDGTGALENPDREFSY